MDGSFRFGAREVALKFVALTFVVSWKFFVSCWQNVGDHVAEQINHGGSADSSVSRGPVGERVAAEIVAVRDHDVLLGSGPGSKSEPVREPGSAPGSEFVQLFTHHQRRLFLYILSQIHNPVEAEEVLQETNVVIWSKSARFQQGTNFLAWVSQIANFEVLKHRARKRREKLVFSDEFLESVAQTTLERSDELESRRAALADCLTKLRPKDRELIEKRYAPGERGKHLAENLGRPANSVYQSLGRIRRALLECIEQQLPAEVKP